MRSGAFATSPEDSSTRGRVSRWIAALLVLALVLFLVAWLLGYVRLTTDPRVVEIQKLQADAQQQFAANGGPTTLAEAQGAVAVAIMPRDAGPAQPKR